MRLGHWLSRVYLRVRVFRLICIKVRCCGCRRLLASLESRDQLRAATYALCITVERSHRQRLLHKQESSDGVVGGDSEVSLGHGLLQIMFSVESVSD